MHSLLSDLQVVSRTLLIILSGFLDILAIWISFYDDVLDWIDNGISSGNYRQTVGIEVVLYHLICHKGSIIPHLVLIDDGLRSLVMCQELLLRYLGPLRAYIWVGILYVCLAVLVDNDHLHNL